MKGLYTSLSRLTSKLTPVSTADAIETEQETASSSSQVSEGSRCGSVSKNSKTNVFVSSSSSQCDIGRDSPGTAPLPTSSWGLQNRDSESELRSILAPNVACPAVSSTVTPVTPRHPWQPRGATDGDIPPLESLLDVHQKTEESIAKIFYQKTKCEKQKKTMDSTGSGAPSNYTFDVRSKTVNDTADVPLNQTTREEITHGSMGHSSSSADLVSTPRDVVLGCNSLSENRSEILGETSEDAFLPQEFTYDRKRDGPAILCVFVVGFHHINGPVIEAMLPSPNSEQHQLQKDSTTELEGGETCKKQVADNNLVKSIGAVKRSEEDRNVPGEDLILSALQWIPFLALPDASHHTTADFVYFIPPSVQGRHVYCVSCFRRIAANLLEFRDTDVTRAHVQKAVCVLSQVPLFGLLQSQLERVTQTYFNQRDFRDTSLFSAFYEHLNQRIDWMNLPFTEAFLNLEAGRDPLVHQLRPRNILVLLKAILLECKIVVYSSSAARASSAVEVLVSFLPEFRTHGLRWKGGDAIQAKLNRIGFPLDLFQPPHSAVYPYLSLQLLDSVNVNCPYLVGVTNRVLLDCPLLSPDVIADVDAGRIELVNKDLTAILTLTEYDCRFIRQKISPSLKATGYFLSPTSQSTPDCLRQDVFSEVVNSTPTTFDALSSPVEQSEKPAVTPSSLQTEADDSRIKTDSTEAQAIKEILKRRHGKGRLRSLFKFQWKQPETDCNRMPADVAGDELNQQLGADELNQQLGADELNQQLGADELNHQPFGIVQCFSYQHADSTVDPRKRETTELPSNTITHGFQKWFKQSRRIPVNSPVPNISPQTKLKPQLGQVTPHLPKGFSAINLIPEEDTDESSRQIDDGERSGRSTHRFILSWFQPDSGISPKRNARQAGELATASARESYAVYMETFLRLLAFAAGPSRSIDDIHQAIDSKHLGLRDFGAEFLKAWITTRNGLGWLKRHHLPVMPQFTRPPRLGWALYSYANGDIYVGQFQRSLRHGRGIYASRSGMWYDGYWEGDKRHGEGTLVHEDLGFYYIGQWSADKKNGHGCLLSAKERYWGEFLDNKFHGKGRYIDTAGNEYEGYFQHGKLHGAGKLRKTTGEVSGGEWVNGKLVHEGTRFYCDGRNYVGNFEENEPDGEGIMRFPDGTLFDGRWKCGKRHGEGTLTIPVSVFPSSYRHLPSKSAETLGSSKESRSMSCPDPAKPSCSIGDNDPCDSGSNTGHESDSHHTLRSMIVEGRWKNDTPDPAATWSITFPTVDKYTGQLRIDGEHPPPPFVLLPPSQAQITEPIQISPCPESKSYEAVLLEILKHLRQWSVYDLVPQMPVTTPGRTSEKTALNADAALAHEGSPDSSPSSSSTSSHEHVSFDPVFMSSGHLSTSQNNRNICINVAPHGTGLSKNASDGSLYNGEWFMGMRHGKGEAVWPDGSHYRGEWCYGLRHGSGTYITKEGRVTSGFFSKDNLLITAESLQSMALTTAESEITPHSSLRPDDNNNSRLNSASSKPKVSDLDETPSLWKYALPFIVWPIDTSPYFRSSSVRSDVKKRYYKWRSQLLRERASHCHVAT